MEITFTFMRERKVKCCSTDRGKRKSFVVYVYVVYESD